MAEFRKVKESFEFCAEPAKFYQTALERPIDLSDYRGYCKLTKERFLQGFVKSNIFLPTPDLGFKIQFDVTRDAIKAGIEMKK